jgi:hypothetical protein
MSVRPSALNNPALSGWIFMKFDIWILKKSQENEKFH